MWANRDGVRNLDWIFARKSRLIFKCAYALNSLNALISGTFNDVLKWYLSVLQWCLMPLMCIITASFTPDKKSPRSLGDFFERLFLLPKAMSLNGNWYIVNVAEQQIHFSTISNFRHFIPFYFLIHLVISLKLKLQRERTIWFELIFFIRILRLIDLYYFNEHKNVELV